MSVVYDWNISIYIYIYMKRWYFLITEMSKKLYGRTSPAYSKIEAFSFVRGNNIA